MVQYLCHTVCHTVMCRYCTVDERDVTLYDERCLMCVGKPGMRKSELNSKCHIKAKAYVN